VYHKLTTHISTLFWNEMQSYTLSVVDRFLNIYINDVEVQNLSFNISYTGLW